MNDNLEARLVLLARRLAERNCPVRIEKTGRGAFRLDVQRPLALVARNDAELWPYAYGLLLLVLYFVAQNAQLHSP